MAIQINWKICDNAKECGGIAVCPTGALFWDEEKEKIGVKNDICISCAKCADKEEGCPIGAIIVTSTDQEYADAEKLINDDPRNRDDLLVDRFGAAPISDDVIIEKTGVSALIENGITIIERFTDSSIQCLLHSIEVDDVRRAIKESKGVDFKYYKCEEPDVDESIIYPVIDIYKDGQLLGTVEGYFEDEQEDEYIDKIKVILDTM